MAQLLDPTPINFRTAGLQGRRGFRKLDCEHETCNWDLESWLWTSWLWTWDPGFRNLDSEHLGFEHETWVPESWLGFERDMGFGNLTLNMKSGLRILSASNHILYFWEGLRFENASAPPKNHFEHWDLGIGNLPGHWTWDLGFGILPLNMLVPKPHLQTLGIHFGAGLELAGKSRYVAFW